MGYYRAGFTDITGVDLAPQKRYPFRFVQADALAFLAEHGHEFDAIHASPPCQAYSEATPMAYRANHPDLIAPLRCMLQEIGKPFVIENVENARAHLVNPILLCGSMLGLPLWRHRYFEIWPPHFVLLPPCAHQRGTIEAEIDCVVHAVQTPVLCTGGGDGKRNRRKTHRPRQPVKEIRWAMEIDWMMQQELSEAIPPVYTQHIGAYLVQILEARWP